MAEKTEVKESAIKNCPACKKVLKRKKRYYRNGGYYCNKNCFDITMAKNAPKVAEEAAK